MPDNHPQLGQVLGEDEGVRDAIHIAIIPVIVGNHMTPGSRVAYNAEADRVFTDSRNTIGIIDPFLPMAAITPGTRVYLFLDPYTITSLSHHWTHPSFPLTPAVPATPVAAVAYEEGREHLEAVKYIESAASIMKMTYDDFMQKLDDFVEDEDYTYDNSEKYKDIDWDKCWRCWSIIENKPIPKNVWAPYTCSC